jgi:hypothetical protein
MNTSKITKRMCYLSGIVIAAKRSHVCHRLFFMPAIMLTNPIANRSFDYAKLFSESNNGLYILPTYDEENGKISDLRQTLKAFLEGSWGMYKLCYRTNA